MPHGFLWSAESDIRPRRIETVVLSRSKLKWTNEPETFRENNEAATSQIRNLKIITFNLKAPPLLRLFWLLLCITFVFDLQWCAVPLPILPHSVSLCEPATSLSSSSHFLSGPGGRGCAHSRALSWEDEREVFTWSCSPVPSSLTPQKSLDCMATTSKYSVQ